MENPLLQKRTYVVPARAVIGPGALDDLVVHVKGFGFEKALVVTDAELVRLGVVQKVTDRLGDAGIKWELYDQVQPNPTCANVHDGLARLQEAGCDWILSVGGGSPQDAAKAIGILATNGGDIREYEGIGKSEKPSLPLVAVNTTAGTASEVTINYVITDEDRHIKMVMVDPNSLAVLAISDPELMTGKPPALTAATGMDAMTHAVEAYLSTGAYPLTDALALEAIRLIARYLPAAVADGNDMEARSAMAWASYIAGMAFNNCGLGYVHSMAHQLGGKYDLPHGVCNAVLLPHIERFNAPACGDKLRNLAEALGVRADAMSREEFNDAAIEAIEKLNRTVGIPSGLKELGVKEEDIEEMARNAMEDVCKGTNPREVSLEETVALYRGAL